VTTVEIFVNNMGYLSVDCYKLQLADSLTSLCDAGTGDRPARHTSLREAAPRSDTTKTCAVSIVDVAPGVGYLYIVFLEYLRMK